MPDIEPETAILPVDLAERRLHAAAILLIKATAVPGVAAETYEPFVFHNVVRHACWDYFRAMQSVEPEGLHGDIVEWATEHGLCIPNGDEGEDRTARYLNIITKALSPLAQMFMSKGRAMPVPEAPMHPRLLDLDRLIEIAKVVRDEMAAAAASTVVASAIDEFVQKLADRL